MGFDFSFITPFFQSPVATFILLLTVGVSVLAFSNPLVKGRFLLVPYNFVTKKDYKTIFTSGLIHANFIHLAMNLLTFYYVGIGTTLMPGLERAMIRYQVTDVDTDFLRLLTHAKFLVIYIVAMVFADLPTILKHKDDPTYACLGASGAISGIMIAYIFFSWDQGISIFGMPGWTFAILYLVGSWAMGRFGHRLRGGSQINHDAHFWGGVIGLIMIIAFYPAKLIQYYHQIAALF